MIGRAPAHRGLYKLARLGVAAAWLALPPQGAAAQHEPARQACSADIGRVCAGIQHGEGRITACVGERFAQLSEPCRNALISGVTITKACKADYQLKCAGIEPGGGRSQACMKDHFAELDELCQKALLLGKLQRQ
jgi:hypothetical protein